MRDLQAIVRRLENRGGSPLVLATLVAVEGSSYRRAGARALFLPTGERIGSISGGCLDEDILLRAQAVAASGTPYLAIYDTTLENDLIWGAGTGCHGVVRVLLERLTAEPEWLGPLAANLRDGRATELAVVWKSADPADLGTRLAERAPAAAAGTAVFRDRVEPAPALTVFGAGDDARPLVRAAKELGWRVAVGDPRPAYATTERFPEADRVVSAPATELADRLAPPPGGVAVVMTHHYAHDRPILGSLLGRPLAFLGLLGPRRRAESILADLAAEGRVLSPEDRARFHAPVGYDIGADTPEEIALSMLAEMRACLAGRDGRPLRDRIRPIHG